MSVTYQPSPSYCSWGNRGLGGEDRALGLRLQVQGQVPSCLLGDPTPEHSACPTPPAAFPCAWARCLVWGVGCPESLCCYMSEFTCLKVVPATWPPLSWVTCPCELGVLLPLYGGCGVTG